MNEIDVLAKKERLDIDWPGWDQHGEPKMTKYSVIDTETSGLFDFSKPADAEGQPRMASITLINLTESLEVESIYDHLVKPEGWALDSNSEAAKVNGLTQERLDAEGIPVRQVLDYYSKCVAEGRVMVAFNAQYDLKIMRGELRRAEMPDLFEDTKNICVMRGLTDVVKAPKASGKGYKFPKLSEALNHFGLNAGVKHDALSDANDCLLLFREMVKLDLVPEAKVHYAKAKMAEEVSAENPRATIGANNPPEAIETPTPYEAVKKEIEDLYGEAKLWLDGGAVDSEEVAQGVNNLIAMMKSAAKKAEVARQGEKAPFDEKIAEIQARYNALTADTKTMKGLTTRAIAACEQALKPFLKKKADALTAQQEKAHREAAEKAAAALAAARAVDHANLEQVEQAEALIKDAKIAQKVAAKAEKQDVRVVGGVGRATRLVKVYRAVMSDPTEAARHYWKTRPDEMKGWLQQMADADVKAGKLSIPGFSVVEEQEVA